MWSYFINVLLCRLYLDIPKLTQHSNGNNVCNERCTCVNTTSHDVPLTRRSFNESRLINFNRMENKIETMSYKHRRSCCIHIVTLTQNLRAVDVYMKDSDRGLVPDRGPIPRSRADSTSRADSD